MHSPLRQMVSHDFEARTLAKMEACLSGKNNLGCTHSPLVNDEIFAIVDHEFHLMLRVSDILIRNLVLAMIHRDQVEVHRGVSPQFVSKLVEVIRGCAISFRVIFNNTDLADHC